MNMMKKIYKSISELFRCPNSGGDVGYRNNNMVSEYDQSVLFPIENGIVRAFIAHEMSSNDVTIDTQNFYSQSPYPTYDEVSSLGALIEKSFTTVFPDMLNRSIPPHATILEAGCGTGQLSNFLSIPHRRVLSVDMTLNSLELGQSFKEKNKLNTSKRPDHHPDAQI